MVPLVTKDEPEIFAEDEAGRQQLLSRVVAVLPPHAAERAEAVAYLEKRRLNHPELVAAFKLGFANRTLPYRLPAVKSRAGGRSAPGQGVGVLRGVRA